MGLIKTINTKIQSAVAKKVPTADEAYSQALFNASSIEEVIKFEKECIIDKIQDAIMHKQTHVFYVPTDQLDYSSIEEELKEKGYNVIKYNDPFDYWIINWNH
nr:MAG TPA: heat shock protein, putative shock, chaperone, Structural Genomics.88A [Caudoviricetes sp.]